MPKVIDKYVLEQQIGKGQFGEVYKGRHQDTLQVVAIKTIRRDTIKGKFYELLENEIRVLKACDNPHIIKLHALKKTPHNYYLMLEYCDGGDMLEKVKKEGPLAEQLVVKYFCQIMNAFQTLVKNKIMHRDFKLANILLHEGSIKIADFGFAKLLMGDDYATTMLGSPLNMAPEVLGGNKYGNKADIWSIGACVYEMLTGKPPYVANNMVDLAKLIQAKPLQLKPGLPQTEQLRDVLKRMLVADVKKRIDWTALFNHQIMSWQARRRRDELELELAEDESLMLNTSKCYLMHNKVLSDVGEIRQNSQVNDYLVEVIRTGKKSQPEEEVKKAMESPGKISKLNRTNSRKLLFHRNIYAFMASVADQILNCQQVQQCNEIAAYVVVRDIIDRIRWLRDTLESKEAPLEGIEHWQQYIKSDDYEEIKGYVEKEWEVFKVFNNSLEPMIKGKALEGGYDADVRELLASQSIAPPVYRKYLGSFIQELARKATCLALEERALAKQQWKLLYYGLKLYQPDMTFETHGDEDNFDFKAFHEQFEGLQQQKMLLGVQKMMVRVVTP